MIIGTIITFFSDILAAVLDLLPTGYLPTAWIGAIGYLWNNANAFSYVFPVDTVLQALIVIITFEGVIFGFRITQWLIGYIPFLW